MLGPVLASIHNLTFYQRLVARLRAAIVAGHFDRTRRELLAAIAAPAASGEPGPPSSG
jgi:queuine/archaeosine tRNA-ribosyltransferase